MAAYSRSDLAGLEPSKPFLVGVDSDGCVFDTMEAKQRRFFHPRILSAWGLERIGPQVRAAAEFVNLRSTWRGSNRFVALLKLFDLLREWPEAAGAGAALPDTSALEAYVRSGLPLGHPSLRAEAERTGDPELARVLAWSLAVNRDIDRDLGPVPPFPGAREALERMRADADVIVVSQTPEEALVKEWRLHGLDGLVRFIAGQELGTKAEHLRLASAGKYAPGRVLVVGDAPGDLAAAREAGAAFFPVRPGAEAASWRHLRGEAFGRFLDGAFAGAYEQREAAAFEALLPRAPPWRT